MLCDGGSLRRIFLDFDGGGSGGGIFAVCDDGGGSGGGGGILLSLIVVVVVAFLWFGRFVLPGPRVPLGRRLAEIRR